MDWGSPQTIKNIWIPGYEFGGPGSCKGDSGGPLIIYDQSEGPQRAKFVQIGVIQVIFIHFTWSWKRAWVALVVERRTHNCKVVGSNPTISS